MATSQAARDRDLYQYYAPWLDVLELRHVPANDENQANYPTHLAQSSRDKALTAFAQLAALRLNVKRAMVSLIDSSTQIILAEATKSLSLVNDDRHRPDDHLWLGNVSIPRNHAICENVFGSTYTVKKPDGENYKAEALVVPDLRQDPRFKDRLYVVSEGGVQFYAGVPINTRLGNQIGVYAVSDCSPRHGLTYDELCFMQDVSATIFEHLEMIKSRQDRDRGESMVKGLGSFIEGLSVLKHRQGEVSIKEQSSEEEDTEEVHSKRSPTSHHREPIRPQEARHSDQRIHLKHSAGAHDAQLSPNGDNTSKPEVFEVETSTSPITSSADKPPDTILATSNVKQIFVRAAQVIRESANVDGCVFFDASSGAFADADVPGGIRRQSTDDTQDSGSDMEGHDTNIPLRRPRTSSTTSNRSRRSLSSDSDHPKPSAPAARILGLSMKHPSPNLLARVSISEEELKRCLQRYPYGRIFNFNERGSVSSGDESFAEQTVIGGGNISDDSDHVSRLRKKRKMKRAKYLPKDMFRLLPGVRAVIFLPLFDFSHNRWCAGTFLWTNNTGQLSNAGDEMPYLKAFGSCIMSEVSSMESMNTNRAKTTFIASISHELRSPLHGILGSIEFLEDTMTTAYQMGLIGSVETCSKTLLDTIDHLLDYAKINNLTRVASRQASRKPSKSSREAFSDGPKMSNSLTTDFDLSCLVEDVIDAVFAGQTFKSARSRGQGNNHFIQDSISEMHAIASNDSMSTEQAIFTGSEKFSGKVIVVLNISKAESWWVRSQPGGLRRVIMNLFGNSIKYCESGSIEASLDIIKRGRSSVKVDFTIKDTGRGMSKDFMTNHLFKAFAQEDSFSHGTGLGLSIVKQIVDSLGGKIAIKSQKNVGTEVKISLKLPIAHGHNHIADDSIFASAVTLMKGKKVCMLNPESAKSDKKKQMQLSKLSSSIATTCKEWFGIEFFESPTVEVDADIFCYAEPPPIEYLLEHHKERRTSRLYGREVALLITCTNAFEAAALRAGGVQHLISLGRIIEVISQPCGPRKLGKVLVQCARRIGELNDQAYSQQGIATQTASEGIPGKELSGTAARSLSEDQKTRFKSQQTRPFDSFRWESDRPFGNTQKGPMDIDTNLEWGKVKSSDTPLEIPSQPSIDRYSPSNSSILSSEGAGSEPANAPYLLLVDDNSINLKLLVTFMKKIKLPFEEAVNGLDALNKFKASCRGFDFILMDISMPIMDGLTATRKIREYERDLRLQPATIIALTGVASDRIQEEAFDAGISHFLTKPVSFKALKQLLVHK